MRENHLEIYSACTEQNKKTVSKESNNRRTLNKRSKKIFHNMEYNLSQEKKDNQCSTPKRLRNRIHENVRRCLFEEESDNQNLEENITDENDQDIAHISREEQIDSEKVNSKQLKRRRIQEALKYKDSYNIYNIIIKCQIQRYIWEKIYQLV